ncbi:GGDEF domain-containing protein [Rhodanobacter sp. DHB23]|uniref:GGDEF domain-containing protein n=1 Tax=Rhodanobacter sp. DHB23 TaxID=2775923 RepID=UPI001786B386|nr:GGDEF domain-containing protein [Rhodanobacter sp. DHB23]MBD8871726.1 GGDEF domain-containing protein [Rhodanobacter sp. DHB23]
MLWRPGSTGRWFAGAAFAGSLCLQAAHAATAIADPDTLLKQTWDLQVTDHPRSLQLLAQLNRSAASLTPDQQWHLRLMNAWEAKYEGDYGRSEALFKDIALHSGDPKLADRASAMLLSQYGATRRYVDAFDLANRLTARLPQVADAKVRYALLLNLSQAMGLAGQTNLAVRYAHMAMDADHAAESRCYAAGILVDVLFSGHRLKPDSPELQQAFEACPLATEPLFNTGIALDLADLYAHEGQPRKALTLLDELQPRVDAAGEASSKLGVLETRAWALAALGDGDAARKAALAVIAAAASSGFDLSLKDAYQVLYRIEKEQGNAAAALGYYEKFAALDKAYLDDINARTLAYETMQQHVLMQKLETEKLSKQNAGLRAQRKLDAKSAEAIRLYFVLLFMALGFGALAMYRLKRSQLGFKRLSHFDGLTAIYNRQHFMGEAGRVLHQLEKRKGAACLAIIDLDHFKHVNDTHGHAMGDEVLRRVVGACKEHLRSADLFGRLGGEEFGILLADCSREQGMAIAERMRAAIEATAVELDGAVAAVSTSIGLAFTDSIGHDLHRLCTEADAALYRAKHDGRNRVMTGAGCLVTA